MRILSTIFTILITFCLASLANAQTADLAKAAPKADSSLPVPAPNYVLGPDDQISIWVLAAEEISGKTFGVDQAGFVSLPLVGRLKAGGLTVEQFEKLLATKLSVVIRDPQVAVSVADFRSQPITVIGAVLTAGTQQLKGRRTLLEALTAAGGLRSDAGSMAKITRRLDQGRIPLSSATEDPTGQFSVAEVNLKALLASENAKENFELRPYDFISVGPSSVVYLVGEIVKPGTVPVNDNEHLTILQVISMAGGLTNVAAGGKAKILRPVLGGPKRAELAVDLKRILSGKAPDQPLLPNDILFVPDSAGKRVTRRAIDEALRMGTVMLTWGAFPR